MGHTQTTSAVTEIREQLGLTRSQLARTLGVSARTIARWEERGQPSHPVWQRRLEDLLAARQVSENA